MKYIILEKYINIDPQDVEQKKKYLKDVEKILSISYGNIGGPVNISSYEELLEPKYFWKLNKRDGKIVALCIYKVSNGGRKISLCGCDGTPEGKERLYALLGEDVTQEARKTWGEFSGAIEHVYKDKLGATIIPNYVAKEILNKLGKDVVSLNPDGVHYTRIINGNEVEKVMLGNVPQEDSLGKMFIQESRKIRVWDKTLTEAKEDKEKFKNWIADGVANSSLREQPQIVDILVNKFVELKPRIKSPYNDFYYWIKNSTFDDFWNYIMGLIQEINHKDEIKQKEKDGAELIYSDDTWKVYHITNYEASAKYGKGTKWCITGTKRWNDGTTGKETFQDYHDKNNVEFYFYLNKNGDKYALALYPNGKSYEIFNAEDVSCAYIPNAPKVGGLPDVSLKDDKKVLINALASDKIDDDIILNAIEELAHGKDEDFDIIFALTSNEVSSIMNEKIPDSYLEYRAVARGEMTPDEYKSITGDTITDLDISNGYFWGGDLPEVEVDEDKFLTKKEACDPKNYQGHKYWYFFEDRTSWNPYELYWADDKVGLYNSLRQLMGFDDMYSFLEALADTLIYEVKEGKLELDKLNGSVSKEYIDNLEESSIKEDVNQDISTVSNAFGTTKEPFLGPSYILPNGKFLKIRNADINISNNGSGDRGLIIHLDVQKWINKQQGKEEKYVDDIGLEEKCIRVNTDQLEHYIVLPKERPNDKQLKSLRDWIDFFYAKTSSDLVLVSYYGPTTTYFKGAVAEDIIEDIKNYYARGMFFENLKEYMDEVTIEKNGEDFPVFATDETYRLKNLLVKGDKAYRIYNDDETYYFQDAAGNKTHYEMLRLALRNGWLANSKLRYGDDDNLTSGSISPESYDEGYMVFIPFNYNKKLRYHTRLGDDGYYNCRVYPFGVMFVRSSDAYENGLFSALGEPDKEIYYDEQYETTIVKSGNNTREFDVYLELQGDPNTAIDTNVMNLRPKEDAMASRDAKIQKSKEVMKECGVPEKLWGKSGQELYFIVRDFMAGDYDDNGFISKEDAKAIVKYLNKMNFSDVPKFEGEIEDKSLQEKIVKKGSKWQVQSEKGKNLGTYDTKKEAEKRLQQVHYFKNLDESSSNKVVAYHGTNNKFDKFQSNRVNWFTDDENYAKNFGNNLIKCELDISNFVNIGELNQYLDYVDEDDDVENVDVYIPDCLKEMSNSLGVSIDDLIDVYEKENLPFEEYNGITYLTGELYDITNSLYFAELLNKNNIDGIIATEDGYTTYGVVNNSCIHYFKHKDNIQEGRKSKEQLIKDNFESKNPGQGCIYITKEGTFINLYPEIDSHEDLCYWLEDEFDFELPYEDEEWAIRQFGWVRCRETPIDVNVIELPKEITQEQIVAIDNWLNNIVSYRELEIGVVDNNQIQRYNLDEYSPSDIINRIKAFYSTGYLKEHYFKHMNESSKYDSSEELLKECGEFIYHATYKSELDKIYKEGLHDFWFGINDYECLDMIEYNHDKYDEEVIIAIPTKYLDANKCDFTVDNGDGYSDLWAGTGIYNGTITKDQFEYIYDVDNEDYIKESFKHVNEETFNKDIEIPTPISRENLPDEVICYRTITNDEFYRLFSGDVIEGQWIPDDNDWVHFDNLTDRNAKIILFYTDYYRFRIYKNRITLKCKFNKKDIVAVAKGRYAVSKNFNKTKVINKEYYHYDDDMVFLDEIGVLSYDLSNVLEIVSIKGAYSTNEFPHIFNSDINAKLKQNADKYNIKYDNIKENLKEAIKHVDEDKHKDIIFKIDDTENINGNLTYVFVKVGIYGDNYYLPESLFVEYNNDTKEVILDTNRQCNKSILSKINYELNLDYDYVIKQLTEFIIDKKDSIQRFNKAHKLLGEELQETDNEGNILSKEQIEFFKNSKIRDNQGRLIVCYHGTSGRVFDIFDKDRFSTGAGDVDFGAGFYFTRSKNSAKSYADIGADEDHPSQIFNVYLNITNPLYIPTKEKDLIPMFKKLNIELNYEALDTINNSTEGVWSDYFKSLICTIYNDNQLNAEQHFTNDLVKNGYDGVVFKDEIVAFEPNQIKSITNKNPTNSENINEDLLSTLKTNLSSYKYDIRTTGWHNKYGDVITDFDDDWEPEFGDWYYENDTHIFDNGKARLECCIDEENKVFTIEVLWKRNNSQGEATKLIRKVLELVPEDWKIEINNNINTGYWKHIFDKYFPNRTYSDVYESLNDVEQQFYDKIGDYFYHATHKRNVDNILKHGLNKEVWLGVTPEDCIDYVKFNHKWKDDDIALFKIKKDSIKDDNLHFPVSGWGSLVGDAFYDGSISADKLELVEGVSKEFDSITKTELEYLNKWLDKYGFEVELITDKETLDDIDWSSQYGDDAVGMFLADIQDNASVFPIALNKKVISKLCKDKDDLIRGIKGTLWHEAGHGIYRFLEDVMDMPEDEEDCVEEFARYREVSELFDILQDYMKQDESLKESIGFPITVYTYQKPQVRELLENGETYIASYERANYSHYKDLSNLLGLSNCPIFGALSKEDLYAMLNSSGINFEEENILHLEIPKENLHYMEYYDWTDYMYALDDAESFEEETGLSLQDLENLIKTQKSPIDYVECQVVFDRIEPQWYEDGKEEKALNESKQDFEKFRQWCGNDELYNRFMELRPRLANIRFTDGSKGDDIYFWMKNNTPKDLEDTLQDLEVTPTKKEREKRAQEGAKLLYNQNGWKVFKIETLEASQKYGRNTLWCISGQGGYDACSYWNGHEDCTYFYIDTKNNKKYALIWKKGDIYWTIYNELDEIIPYIPNAPRVEGLPDVSTLPKELCQKIAKVLGINASDIIDIKSADNDPEIMDAFIDYDSRENYIVDTKDKTYYIINERGYEDITQEVEEFISENEL